MRPPRRSGIQQVVEVVGDRVNLVAAREKIKAFEVLYTDFTKLQTVVAERVDYYNEDGHHSGIGNRSPKLFVVAQWQKLWSHN